MSRKLNGVADVRRVAVVATTLGLAAASSLAQSADPPPPSLSELARLVGEQARALEEQRREMEEQKQEIARLCQQLEETQQLSLAAHNRLEEMAKAAPAPTVDAAVEERLAQIEASVQQIPDVQCLFGNRVNKDGQKGSSSQLQLGTSFRF